MWKLCLTFLELELDSGMRLFRLLELQMSLQMLEFFLNKLCCRKIALGQFAHIALRCNHCFVGWNCRIWKNLIFLKLIIFLGFLDLSHQPFNFKPQSRISNVVKIRHNSTKLFNCPAWTWENLSIHQESNKENCCDFRKHFFSFTFHSQLGNVGKGWPPLYISNLSEKWVKVLQNLHDKVIKVISISESKFFES